MADNFDFIVIGGGSGGIAAARRAAEYGARVLLIERGRLGGTCVNAGCVPKKVMWNAAQIGHALELAGDYGFRLDGDGGNHPRHPRSLLSGGGGIAGDGDGDFAGDGGGNGERGNRSFDWAALKRARDGYVARLNRIYADNLRGAGVTVIRAEASFVDGGDGHRHSDSGDARAAPSHRHPRSLLSGGGDDGGSGDGGGDGPRHSDSGDALAGDGETRDITVKANGKTHHAPHILIATGGAPVLPKIPGAELAITSDGFFELESQPARALIIGAGYIATELAGVLHALGSRVTLLLRKDRLLRAFDPIIGDTVLAHMRATGVDIRTGLQCREIFRADDGSLGYRATATGDGASGKTAATEATGFDCVLFAVSRAPATAELRLARADIEVDQRGFIPVDEFQNTATTGVYALGDITDAPALTPVAIAAGRRLADRLFGGQPSAKLDSGNIPTVVFSHPPAGSVGLSEAQAAAAHGRDNIKIYTSRFVNMRYALTPDKPPSVVKLITAGARETVVGCHIVGDGADEMLQGFAVAMNLRATKSDFDRTVAIHPTAAEEVVTM